jgi:hypothetical protein
VAFPGAISDDGHMTRHRTITRAIVVAAAAGCLATGAIPAQAATGTGPSLSTSVGTWDVAAARLGTAGSLWEPRNTAGLDRTRRIVVIGDSITVANGAVTGGSTYAGTRYGRGARTLWVEEKWAGTGWAADPVVATTRALVGTVRLPLGQRGMRAVVTARVYAECIAQPANANPKPVPARARCARADVLATGGTIEFTARPASTMTAPGTTNVVMRSTGLTYDQLVRAARSLEQVAGAPSAGAGSAQMLGMCQQMISAPMNADVAGQFATSNGYTLRVGTIDGVPQAVTADYRPDRFTVTTVGGAVTACTYG